MKKISQTSQGEASLVTLTNGSGAVVTLSSHGAGIVALRVPDRAGVVADIVAGYTNPEGLANRLWDVELVGDDEVRFSIRINNKNDFQTLTASYRWSDENTLELYLSASKNFCAQKNPLARTFFNLDGHGSEAFRDETLWLNSSEPAAPKLLRNIFTHGNKAICLTINDWQEGVMNDAALLASHSSGRQLHVFTTLPDLLIQLDEGADGVAIECGQVLTGHPSDEYNQLIFYEFSTF